MSRTRERIEAWKKFEPKLQVGDIMLTRDTSPLLSRLIRKATGSYWNHVVLVFFVPDEKILFNNTLVISAETHGIEVHRIQRYTHHFDHVDVGVKRVPGLDTVLKEKIISYAFNQIDIPYDYVRLFGFVIKTLESVISSSKKHLHAFLTNKDAFICSSFIQKAFYEAIEPKFKNNVIFKNDFDATSSLEDITPADIARSTNLKWVYNPHN